MPGTYEPVSQHTGTVLLFQFSHARPWLLLHQQHQPIPTPLTYHVQKEEESQPGEMAGRKSIHDGLKVRCFSARHTYRERQIDLWRSPSDLSTSRACSDPWMRWHGRRYGEVRAGDVASPWMYHPAKPRAGTRCARFLCTARSRHQRKWRTHQEDHGGEEKWQRRSVPQ